MANETTQTFWEDSRGNRFELTLNLGNVGDVDRADFSAILTSMKLGKTPPGNYSIMENPDEAIELIVNNHSITFATIYILIRDQLSNFDSQIAEWKKARGIEGAINAQDREAWFLSGIGGKQLESGREALINAIGNFFQERKTGYLNSLKNYQEMVKTTIEGNAKIQKKRVEDLKYILDKESEVGSKEIRKKIEDALKAGDLSSLSAESSASPQVQ